MRPTAAEVTSSSAPKSEPAADDVADTLAPARGKRKKLWSFKDMKVEFKYRCIIP